MSARYEEIFAGESVLRQPPGQRHELICARLCKAVFLSLKDHPASRALPPRSVVELCPGTILRPDLALVTRATGKLWLAAEIIEPGDHSVDTVQKKELYENARLPRLWMVDPRYDNVEVYHSGAGGLALRAILAARDKLDEVLLPGFGLGVKELFGP